MIKFQPRLIAGFVLCAVLLSGCGFGSIQFGSSSKPSAALASAKPSASDTIGDDAGDVEVATAKVITSGDDLTADLPDVSLSYANPAATPSVNALITKYAAIYQIPEELIHRQVKKESNYNPAARNGPYWGLMQIRIDTASTMGYRGNGAGLLDAETNIKYAGKYLRGAYLVARGDIARAMKFYASGYYYDAKRMGLLKETGLR